ncbi:hypothetical protein V6N11_080331 [Hibiscus sabdariffa]|uniref:Uncharacterized protein n=1 Tax=Hibiscus sabdariffa TaxID=183260 RepID=A0ABR2R7M3_9ROSI
MSLFGDLMVHGSIQAKSGYHLFLDEHDTGSACLNESVEHLMTNCNFAMQLFHSLGLPDALPSEEVSWKEQF